MGNNWLCKTITWKTSYLNIKYLKILFIITPRWKMKKKKEQMPPPHMKPNDRRGAQYFLSHPWQLQHVCVTWPLTCSRRGLWSSREKLGGSDCYRLFFVTVSGSGLWWATAQYPVLTEAVQPSKWTIYMAESAGSSRLRPSHRLSELLISFH